MQLLKKTIYMFLFIKADEIIIKDDEKYNLGYFSADTTF